MSRRLPPLNALRTFEAAARCCSFTEAAEQLFVTQSAVSRQIHNLEARLGVVLFERRAGRITLTAAGQRLLPTVRTAFDRIESTTRHLHTPNGQARLRLNVPPTFAMCWLGPRIPDWRARYPDLDLTITTRSTDDLAADSSLDAAIRFGAGNWPDVALHLLMQESHIAVCAPQLLPIGTPLDLSRQTLLHVVRGSQDRFPTWKHWLDAAGIAGVETDGGLEFDVLAMAIRAAVGGVGVTIADRHMVAQELSRGELVQPLDVETPGHESYWLATRLAQPLSPELALFSEWLNEQLGSQRG